MCKNYDGSDGEVVPDKGCPFSVPICCKETKSNETIPIHTQIVEAKLQTLKHAVLDGIGYDLYTKENPQDPYDLEPTKESVAFDGRKVLRRV